MAEQSDDKLLEHEYDGIREYDNPLPRWWLWIFYVTIVFVPFYYFAPSPFGEGKGVVADYEAEVAALQSTQAPAPEPALSDDALLALASKEEVREEGEELYAKQCASCHRADGGGLIGPNLTDDAWIHGGAPTEIHATIVNGVLAKGMPPWGRLLKPEEVDALTAYVLSLKGTNPPNAKAAEGPAAPAAPVGG